MNKCIRVSIGVYIQPLSTLRQVIGRLHPSDNIAGVISQKLLAIELASADSLLALILPKCEDCHFLSSLSDLTKHYLNVHQWSLSPYDLGFIVSDTKTNPVVRNESTIKGLRLFVILFNIIYKLLPSRFLVPINKENCTRGQWVKTNTVEILKKTSRHNAQSLPLNIILNQRQAWCKSVHAAECRITRAVCIFIVCSAEENELEVD